MRALLARYFERMKAIVQSHGGTVEQAAEPGEVLIGEATLALVQEAAVTEPVEPLALKGKSEPVPAYRLVGVLAAPERSHAMRFVGRGAELARIVEAWDRAEAFYCRAQ